jgi:hypothetical protein
MTKVIVRAILLASVCAFLFACSKYSQQNFDKIKTNMSMKEVISILGEPTNSESVNIMGISGTSAVWKDKNAEIDIQFLNGVVAVKAFSKLMDETSGKDKK